MEIESAISLGEVELQLVYLQYGEKIQNCECLFSEDVKDFDSPDAVISVIVG